MRIQIEPRTGLLEPAHYFSVDDARIINQNVACTIAFWSSGGRKLDEQTRILSDAQYAAWCDTGADSDDMRFFTTAHAETLGLVEILPPPPGPPPPPPTPEEVEAQRQAAIAALQSQIADLQAQLDNLQNP